MLGTEIARANAVRAAEQARRLLRSKCGQCATKLHSFIGLAQRYADVTRERIVASQPFIRSFEDDDVLFASQRVDDRGFGERSNDIDVNRADLGVALLAQVITRRLNVVRRAAK